MSEMYIIDSEAIFNLRVKEFSYKIFRSQAEKAWELNDSFEYFLIYSKGFHVVERGMSLS
jgi:hypothetical protein